MIKFLNFLKSKTKNRARGMVIIELVIALPIFFIIISIFIRLVAVGTIKYDLVQATYYGAKKGVNVYSIWKKNYDIVKFFAKAETKQYFLNSHKNLSDKYLHVKTAIEDGNILVIYAVYEYHPFENSGVSFFKFPNVSVNITAKSSEILYSR